MQNAHTCICVSFCWAHKLVSYLISFSLFLFKQFIAYFFLTTSRSMDSFVQLDFIFPTLFLALSLSRSISLLDAASPLALATFNKNLFLFFWTLCVVFFIKHFSIHTVNRPLIVDLSNVGMRWSSHLAYENDDLCVWYAVDPLSMSMDLLPSGWVIILWKFRNFC